MTSRTFDLALEEPTNDAGKEAMHEGKSPCYSRGRGGSCWEAVVIRSHYPGSRNQSPTVSKLRKELVLEISNSTDNAGFIIVVNRVCADSILVRVSAKLR
jgi:hypothetical protein